MKKNESYSWALKQVRAQVKRHVDNVATLANTAAILKQRMPGFFWVGFYLLRDDKLLLGPFQGPPACMQLTLDKGVCAEAVKRGATVVVDDVDRFDGHVACDGRSRSEIVVPLMNMADQLVAVLDIDSTELGYFSSQDVKGLEAIAAELARVL